MEPHDHPAYEDTFQRIATILDVVAEEQNELQRGQAELQRSQASAFTAIERMSVLLEQHIDSSRERDTRFWNGLNAVVERLDTVSERLNTLAEKDGETTDRLNALIDLMDGHFKEHDKDGH